MSRQQVTIFEEQKIPDDVLAEVENASRLPIDVSDIPAMTAEECKLVAAIARKRREARKKKIISLRVPQETIEKAKALLGSGYTSVLSRVLVMAVDNPEIIRRCL